MTNCSNLLQRVVQIVPQTRCLLCHRSGNIILEVQSPHLSGVSPVKFQHLEENQPELVVFPAVDDDVDAAVKNL